MANDSFLDVSPSQLPATVLGKHQYSGRSGHQIVAKFSFKALPVDQFISGEKGEHYSVGTGVGW